MALEGPAASASLLPHASGQDILPASLSHWLTASAALHYIKPRISDISFSTFFHALASASHNCEAGL